MNAVPDDLASKGKAIVELGTYAPRRKVRRERVLHDPVDDRYAINGCDVNGGDVKPPGMPKVWAATDLKPAARPRWLAKSRIPRAAVSLIIGDEGIGKSLLWVWLVAVVTTGREVPEFGIPAREPGHVIIAAVTEDDWCSAVLPRLQAAGADLSMVRVICAEPDGSGPPVFPRDLDLIRDADPKPDLVIVDSWLDTVPSSMKVRDPQGASEALRPWKDLATVTDAALTLICHTNRVASASTRDRYGVTLELRKKARMSLYCQRDEDGALIVGPEKANGAAPVSASAFTIDSIPMWQPTAEHDGTVPLLRYAGTTSQTASQHAADAFAATNDRDHTNSSDDAVAWLAEALGGGPQWSATVNRQAEICGITITKLRTAKRRLNVDSVHVGGDGPWYMSLPTHRGQMPDGPAPAPLSS